MTAQKDDLYYRQGLAVPETPEPGKEPKPWAKTQVVGKPLPRADAYQRVSGAAIYPSDVHFPDTLYGAILGCPHPHALVEGVDTSAAEKMPGVWAVITGKSPEADLSWLYRDGVKTRLFDKTCRHEGESVAAVAAEIPYQAWDAVRAIKVQYKKLKFVVDEKRALEPNAFAIHAKGNIVGKPVTYQRGDINRGFAEADEVLEEQYRSECELHTPMELHGCVAKWDGDLLTIWESTQGVYAVQQTVADVLRLPLAKVRVIGHYMGGGFGSKLVAGKYTIIASILAMKTGRPVKLFLSREETFLNVGNRPPGSMRLKAGVKKDGTLTALDFSCIATGGAYPANGISLVDWLVRDLYTCPHVYCECIDAYTNTGPARPFRAPGHPQGAWALEQMLDALAEKIGMDPVELRMKNIPTFSQARDGNPPYTTTGLQQCLEKGAEAFGWKQKREELVAKKAAGRLVRGVGMAACEWFAGGGNPPSTVIVRLFADGSANLNMGASDLGTGTKTVMAMVVGEELGIKIDKIQIEHADTGTTQFASPSGGSKTVPTESPAVRAAAIQVKQRLLKMAAEDLKTDPSKLKIVDGEVIVNGSPDRKLKITKISKFQQQKVIVGVGYRGPNPPDRTVNPFGVQFCEVEVNTKTGEVKLIRFVAAHDSGRVMNALTYESQVIGGVTMGIGFGMTEARILDRNQTGKLVSKNWHDYKLPTALDVPPEIVTIAIDAPDAEANSTGAKGLGEPVTIPTGAAIANAVYHATGVRVTTAPLTPMQLVLMLAERRKEG